MELVGKGHGSMSEYIEKSQMKKVGYCASDVEFHATANAIGVDIFAYRGDTSLKYSCTSRLLTNEGIYLKCCEDNNFEAVVCVEHLDEDYCFDLCKLGNLSEPLYMCTRKSKEEAVIIATATISSQQVSNIDYIVSKYVKRSKDLKKKMKYLGNKLYMEKVKEERVGQYNKKHLYRSKLKKRSIAKYHDNDLFRSKVKKMSIGKYREDALHRAKVKKMSIGKYQEDARHMAKVKKVSIRKYRVDALHMAKVKKMSIGKYWEDVLHREKLKKMSKSKYRRNKIHKQNVKSMSRRKYLVNPEQRKRVTEGNKMRRKQMRERGQKFNVVMQRFLEKVRNGPEFVCCVCHRLLFSHQVLQCKRDHYNKRNDVALIADKCITEDYLHKCNADCVMPCQWLVTARGQLWVCYTCHYKIKKGEMPAESVKNNLGVDVIPEELACLNSLEQHLIALHIPFMKMLALPRGRQNGVHGPVTCVPANIVQTNNVLPRSNMEGSLLPVKLKRKLTYKGDYEYQYVDSMHVRQALQFLKETNVHYGDIECNEAWLNEFF
ncbi:hypothetical protein F2P81_002634 [Scophthalmus maximus]|uniref:DUF6570 domain-containing protein n=1 Tax=Scophthalmus maximus TaxID=52904 RepID=A0A6A4TLG9_SCOMX|nr:hypothetical protein F2P81_002634 [Scophthalmus maximus]